MSQPHQARPSAIAGSWYPGKAVELKATIQQYLDLAVPARSKGTLTGLVVPHAGYIYSGQTAAYAFKLLEGKSYDRVILTSPFHAMTFEALLTSDYSAYQTPLGEIPVDTKALDRIDEHLSKRGMQAIKRIKREQEHSLEIELPFLQVALTDTFELVPLMVRTHHPDTLKTLAAILAELVQEKPTLMVASTDLSHFNTASTAEKLDRCILEDIHNLDPMQLLADNETGKGSACGAGAVAMMLFALQQLGANHVDILQYTHSGSITGDHHSVVGYGAAAVYQQDV